VVEIRAVAFLDDGTAVVAKRFAVVSPHIEIYQTKKGPIIAFALREPIRDDQGRLWRVLLVQSVTAVENKQAMSGYEPSASRMFSLSYFATLCPDKPSMEECLNDIINNVVQKKLGERFNVMVDGRYMIAIDTSPAQVERMVEALHADINSMLTAAYAEFQHWLQNVRTFERLAKAVARGGVSWLILGLIAILFLVMAPQLLPLIQQFMGGLWR
jgi:hypothetical protein